MSYVDEEDPGVLKVEDVKTCAIDCGADLVGITVPAELDEDARAFDKWLRLNYNAGMGWLQKNVDVRNDPGKFLPGCKSIIAIAVNYYTPQLHFNFPNFPKISRYAWGRDYHKVLCKILGKIQDSIAGSAKDKGTQEAEFRIAVDSGPFRDKIWAFRAGLGWIGKNSLLVTREFGSWVFLGALLTTVEFEGEYDREQSSQCGKCRICIDKCPTSAIRNDCEIDSRACISYLTIEHMGNLPDRYKESLNGWVFGCDTCQDVCPWNRFAKPTRHKDFHPREGLVVPDLQLLSKLSEDEFEKLTAGTPIRRAGCERLRRNALAVMGLL